MQIDFAVINDTQSPDALPALYARNRPGYDKWMRRAPRTDTDTRVACLREHMPELMPTFDALLARLGSDDETARFLTLYDPPRVVRACSQAVLDSDTGPVLLRTYDHHPDLFEAVVLSADWAGVSTLALADCVWGALDGINEHGLAVALAFGGRNAVGPGFAAPLVVRYLLQTCATVRDAKKALKRVPVYMPYTFVVVDAKGRFVTAFLGPDRDPVFVTRRCSANHQSDSDWPEYTRQTHSLERLSAVEALLTPTHDLEASRQAFLNPPIWRDDYANASGSLYAAEYSPHSRALTLRWPNSAESFTLGRVATRSFTAVFDAPSIAER